MFPRYTTYMGKRYELMLLEDALTEYNTQKAQGKMPAIIDVYDGYIVTEAIFKKEGK